ncbi:WXG100 family type VII secretion target [Streptomyces sp. NPDC093109]|uniref:WXG100 family type VII secretion target n=1 Tax=Streptomyces sp. NPDC093109 TaxID=3154977 RepID=UPI00344CBCA8
MATPAQKANSQKLGKLQEDIALNFEDVKGQLKQLQATIDSLEGAWQGIGAGAFNTKQKAINDRVVDIGLLLVKFQNAIGAARNINSNTEHDIEAALRGISVDEGGSGGAASASAAQTTRISSLNSF